MIEWQEFEYKDDIVVFIVPELGTVKIVPENRNLNSFMVFINDKIAWSNYRGTLTSVKLGMRSRIRAWQHFNKFGRKDD